MFFFLVTTGWIFDISLFMWEFNQSINHNMYVCISSTFSRVWINRVRCSRSAEQGNRTFPCPRSRLRISSRETGSAVPSRVSLLTSILMLNLVLTYGIPPEFRGGVRLSISTAIRHRVSPEFVGSRNCVPMAFTAQSPPALGQ